MTREQAQVYAKMSREDIAKIDTGYERHYNVLRAFADGKEIEIESKTGTWYACDEPVFSAYSNYRIKPAEEQTDDQEESVVKENLTTESTEKLVESLDGKPLTAMEAYIIRRLRLSNGTYAHFLALTENEFDLLNALRRMMKENRGSEN